jgi:hypothetical protein
MGADIVAFSLGLSSFSKENEYLPAELQAVKSMAVAGAHNRGAANRVIDPATLPSSSARNAGPLLQVDADSKDTRRSVVVVCPSRELSYPLSLSKDLGADTTTADFSQFSGGDILKSASKWIDLSGSETIWRD